VSYPKFARVVVNSDDKDGKSEDFANTMPTTEAQEVTIAVYGRFCTSNSVEKIEAD
jgi:hypothetical protein